MAGTGKVDHIWRCRCGAGHFLSLTWWRGDPSGFLEIEGRFEATLWRRVRQAARMLFTGHAGSNVGLVFGPDTAADIVQAIAEYAVANAPPPPPQPPWPPAAPPPPLPPGDLRGYISWPP